MAKLDAVAYGDMLVDPETGELVAPEREDLISFMAEVAHTKGRLSAVRAEEGSALARLRDVKTVTLLAMVEEMVSLLEEAHPIHAATLRDEIAPVLKTVADYTAAHRAKASVEVMAEANQEELDDLYLDREDTVKMASDVPGVGTVIITWAKPSRYVPAANRVAKRLLTREPEMAAKLGLEWATKKPTKPRVTIKPTEGVIGPGSGSDA